MIPDYSQTAENHASLLVLIQQIGNEIQPAVFENIQKILTGFRTFTLGKPTRKINLVYKNEYSKEENAWGTFQAHRKALGLIHIGQCNLQENRAEDNKNAYLQLHKKNKAEYQETLLDSVLVLIDNNNNIHSQKDEKKNVIFYSENKDELEERNGEVMKNTDNPQNAYNTKPPINKQTNGESYTNIWCFSHQPTFEELEDKMADFFTSLFWVLESKRLDRAFERMDNMTLLMTPLEKVNKIFLQELENKTYPPNHRSYKKRCLGRFRKHLGDLCLLAGVPGEATLHYQTCLDLLKASNDFLWMGGAQEGLAIASFIILRPKMMPRSFIFRNLSYSSKRGVSKNHPINAFSSVPSLDLAGTYETEEPMHEDILTFYKEAIINYSKSKDSVIMEFEASLKAARLLAIYRRVLEAADILQSAMRVSMELKDEQKVIQFTVLSSIYAELGLARKASFFKRFAAMISVASGNQDAWKRCHSLLLGSFPGFRLSLQPSLVPSQSSNDGWPSLKVRVMHELVYSSTKIDPNISLRHIGLFLHSLFEDLSDSQRAELCGILQSYTSKIQSTTQPMTLSGGYVLAPIIFTKFPLLRSIKVCPLSPELRPLTPNHSKSLHSKHTKTHPFIYSPFIPIKHQARSGSEDIEWVKGDMAYVELTLHNPLSISLSLENLSLQIEGVGVVVEPINVVLSPMQDQHIAKLSVLPTNCGTINIVGYSVDVLGVRSSVKFKDIIDTQQRKHRSGDMNEKYTININPVLPLLRITCEPTSTTLSSLHSLPLLPSKSPINEEEEEEEEVKCQLNLFHGERLMKDFYLYNIGKLPISKIRFIKSCDKIAADLLEKVLKIELIKDKNDKKDDKKTPNDHNIYNQPPNSTISSQNQPPNTTNSPKPSQDSTADCLPLDCYKKAVLRVKISEGIHRLLRNHNSAEISLQVQYSGEDGGDDSGGVGRCDENNNNRNDGGVVRRNGVDEDLSNFKEEMVITVEDTTRDNINNSEETDNKKIEDTTNPIINHKKERNTTTTATNILTTTTNTTTTNPSTNTTITTTSTIASNSATNLTSPTTNTTTLTLPATTTLTLPTTTTLNPPREAKWRQCSIILDISLHPCIHAYALHVLPHPSTYEKVIVSTEVKNFHQGCVHVYKCDNKSHDEGEDGDGVSIEDGGDFICSIDPLKVACLQMSLDKSCDQTESNAGEKKEALKKYLRDHVNFTWKLEEEKRRGQLRMDDLECDEYLMLLKRDLLCEIWVNGERVVLDSAVTCPLLNSASFRFRLLNTTGSDLEDVAVEVQQQSSWVSTGVLSSRHHKFLKGEEIQFSFDLTPLSSGSTRLQVNVNARMRCVCGITTARVDDRVLWSFGAQIIS